MKTCEAKLLLGWMAQDEVLKYLCEECVPVMTTSEALKLWNIYKAKVAALSPRTAPAPPQVRLSFNDKIWAKKILKLKTTAPNILGLAKVDPLRLVVHQLMVILDHARDYEPTMGDPKKRAKCSLGFDAKTLPATQSQVGNNLVIDLPHFEFNLGLNPQAKQFAIEEMARWVSVYEFSGRMLLWGGYHRTYALTSQTYPDDAERLLLAIRTTDANALLGLSSTLPERRDVLLGERPPLFADFFDDSLCLTINLRKRRRQFLIDTTTGVASQKFVDE